MDSSQVAFLKFIGGLWEVFSWVRDQEGLDRIIAIRTIVGNPFKEASAGGVTLVSHQLIVPGCSSSCKNDYTFEPAVLKEVTSFPLYHEHSHRCQIMTGPSFFIVRISFVVA